MASSASLNQQTETAPHRTLWGTALLYGHDLASVAVSFFLTPYIAAGLGQYRFGVWSVIVSSLSLLAVLELGIGPATIKFASESLARNDRASLNRTMSTVWFVGAGLSSLVLAIPACVLLAAESFRDFFLTPEIKLAAFLVAVNMALSILETPLGSLLFSFSRIEQIAAARLVGLAVFAVTTVLYLRAGFGMVGLAGAWVSSQVVKTVCSLVFTRRASGLQFLSPRWLSGTKLRELSGFSFYGWLGTIAYLIVLNADNMIIGAAVGASAVASYAATYRISALGARLLRLLPASLFSRFCLHSGQGGTRHSLQLHRLLVLLCGGAGWTGATLGIIAGREFIGAWISPQFFAGYPALLFNLLSMVAIGYIAASQGVGMAWNKVRTVYLLSAAEAGLNIVLSLVLVKPLGPAGVALATLLPQAFLTLAVLPRMVCALIGDSVRFYYSSLWKGATLFGVLAVLGRAAATAAGDGLWVAMGIGLLAAGLYALLYFLLIVGPQERQGMLLHLRAVRSSLTGYPPQAGAELPY